MAIHQVHRRREVSRPPFGGFVRSLLSRDPGLREIRARWGALTPDHRMTLVLFVLIEAGKSDDIDLIAGRNKPRFLTVAALWPHLTQESRDVAVQSVRVGVPLLDGEESHVL